VALKGSCFVCSLVLQLGLDRLRLTRPLQITQSLLQDKLGRPLFTAEYAIKSHTWAMDAVDVYNTSSQLNAWLGPGSDEQWDYVIFQVPPHLHPTLMPTACKHNSFCQGLQVRIHLLLCNKSEAYFGTPVLPFMARRRTAACQPSQRSSARAAQTLS
jgi:hypothetical protein